MNIYRGPELAIYHVSQLTNYIREMIGNDFFLNDVWIEGEVQNLARPSSGNCYYTLRDSRATIRCAMFRNKSRGSELLSNGTAVIAHGQVAIYEQRGDLQIIVDQVQPEGMGEYELKLEQLKLKLEAEGLFDHSRKRPVPPYPRRIGVITSPTGSVWHDIRTVVERRYPVSELVLAPSAVQGDQATSTIQDAFRALDRIGGVDVVILARGGGSHEDLAAFNEEGVARIVFSSKVPVISAIGHETDQTIVDLTADLRAPTPSVAAELAVPDIRDIAASVGIYQQQMTSYIVGGFGDASNRVSDLQTRCERECPDVDSFRQRIDQLLENATKYMVRDIKIRSERARSMELRLKALSPSDTLRRGYAIVRSSDTGNIVSDASKLVPSDRFHVTLKRGSVEGEVVDSHPAPTE